MPQNTAFLFGAFAVAWLLIAGYLLFLGNRIGGLRQDIEALRDDLNTQPSPTTAASDTPSDEASRG